MATPVGKTRRLIVRDREYRVVHLPEHQFFGAVQVNAYGSPAMMAEPEKAILDSLDRPTYAGDIPEIAGMLWRGQSRLDWDRLADFALCFRSQTLVQRLGHLADRLELPITPQSRESLLAGVGKGTAYLGAPSRWSTGGEYDSDWQVVSNVPPAVLRSELEIR